ncbi:cell wall metabolism sensor histidine kinase WalK [Lactobacillus sp. Sy-1]|uniref:cell wall metabolism sensor histidine kinase WalK n=1 Tax=Lactobacillus sp. Sy-1 TaxID=2109645 RepID=UPI001C58B68A|nr:cell wall metabolism sensor histidine kinase WalK [Lactobacillus sp. Sy-1]MBW1605011.1 cell wall metabolism sensor histidine kinase WalK [Lactobacillus sp. Sy-1]
MNKRFKFFQSIDFKMALVFVLMLLVTLEIVGGVFVTQLEKKNVQTFENQLQLPTYVNNSLTNQLSKTNTKKADSVIRSLLSDVDNSNDDQVQVVDSKGIIRGTNQVNNQSIVGQKSVDSGIKDAIHNNKTVTKTIQPDSNKYFIKITPLLRSQNGDVVGAIYIRASLNPVYTTINNITIIYLAAAAIAVLLGILMSIVISRAITRPIDEMKKQTLQIARGDYSGQVQVYGKDELGQLAMAVNNLSVKVEESQETTESERRRLDSVLSNMTDGVLATDRRGNIIIANYEAAKFLDIAEEHIIGHSILDILGIQDQYSLRQLLEQPEEVTLDYTQEGRDLILHAHFTSIQRESGFISGLVCVLRDVTEQQKIDKDRKQFVSNVSHELRTPLTSVHSYIEALQDGAWQDKEIAPQFLKVAQDETDRMIRMINDLLTLSRMDSGTQKINKEMINLNELFNYILNQFDMIIKNGNKTERGIDVSKNYKIIRKFTQQTLWVEIDADRFTQVIDNIMNNAMKYSPDGGEITCSLYETHNQVILSIADQGLGIPKNAVDHIFDRFYRVDKARSRAQGGTGLGLSISREVIEAQGGRIWVQSEDGKGSTFFISLPYEPMEEDLWDEN